MKQKLEKAKQWAWKNRYIIAGTIIGTGVGIAVLNSLPSLPVKSSKEASDFIDEFARCMDMSEVSDYQYVGSGRNTYKLQDLGALGEHIIEYANDPTINKDSELTGLFVCCMKNKSNG